MFEENDDEVVVFGSHEIWQRPLGRGVECAWEPTLEGAYVYIDGDTVTIRPTEKMRLHDEMEYQFRPIRPRQRQKL